MVMPPKVLLLHHPSTHPFIHPSTHPFIHPSTHPSTHLTYSYAGLPPLDVIAIPTLPALVPSLSSSNFSGQLRPLLERLGSSLDADQVWSRTRAAFDLHSSWLRPQPSMSAVAHKGEAGEFQQPSLAQEREARRTARPPVVLAQQVAAERATLAQLQTALAGVIARHAALRTCFLYVTDNDRSRRLVALLKEPEQIDLASVLSVVQPTRGTKEEEQEEQEKDGHGQQRLERTLRELIEQQQTQPFLLDKEAPLLRVLLIPAAPNSASAAIIIAADRLIADEHSLHLIASELTQVGSFLQSRLDDFLSISSSASSASSFPLLTFSLLICPSSLWRNCPRRRWGRCPIPTTPDGSDASTRSRRRAFSARRRS